MSPKRKQNIKNEFLEMPYKDQAEAFKLALALCKIRQIDCPHRVLPASGVCDWCGYSPLTDSGLMQAAYCNNGDEHIGDPCNVCGYESPFQTAEDWLISGKYNDERYDR